MNIFVGSLPFSMEETELKVLFEDYGEVASAKIISDKFSGRSKGFGFVDMPSDEDAQKAIDGLNDTEVGGRKIVVNKSEPKSDSDRRRPSGGGRTGGFNKGGYGAGRDGYRKNEGRNRRDDY
jgi:RNA recognition motif-containing protein